MRLSGWGRFPTHDGRVERPQTRSALADLVLKDGAWTPRGNGRSYGDSALGDHVLDARSLNHFISFDRNTGVLKAGAGVLLDDVLKLCVPQGWFPRVTPGTRYVSLGGAVASDVHGKNHHVDGSFCRYVTNLDLVLGDGSEISISPDRHPRLFRATCGGMGLTGCIVAVELQLRRIASSEIVEHTHRSGSLQEALERFAATEQSTYSVAWIDCLATGRQLGRSLLMLGEHAEQGPLSVTTKRPIPVPIDMPAAVLSRPTITAFNSLYYHRPRSTRRIPFAPYFYPLDSLADWNRLYGAQGFVQYQFVVPQQSGEAALKEILPMIAASGQGSFLAVLKAFGAGNDNLLSFPMRGYTLALDFRMSPSTLPLLDRLDERVLAHGGRLYLTKDARMTEATFKRSYPNWQEFQDIRAAYGALGKFSSRQSMRLGLE